MTRVTEPLPKLIDLKKLLDASGHEVKNGNSMIVLTGPHPGIFLNFSQVYRHLVSMVY